MYELPDSDLWVDPNNVLCERRWLDDQEVIVHYDDVSWRDVTVMRGIPVTTPLRTVIDLATYLAPQEWEPMVIDCLSRGLFTVGEALARTTDADMAARPGAHLLRRFLLR